MTSLHHLVSAGDCHFIPHAWMQSGPLDMRLLLSCTCSSSASRGPPTATPQRCCGAWQSHWVCLDPACVLITHSTSCSCVLCVL